MNAVSRMVGRNLSSWMTCPTIIHLLSFGTELRVATKLSLDLVYLHVRKTFTSGLAGDTHQGREDFTHQGMATFRYQLTAKGSALLSFQRTQRISTTALRDFNDTIVSIGGDYHF